MAISYNPYGINPRSDKPLSNLNDLTVNSSFIGGAGPQPQMEQRPVPSAPMPSGMMANNILDSYGVPPLSDMPDRVKTIPELQAEEEDRIRREEADKMSMLLEAAEINNQAERKEAEERAIRDSARRAELAESARMRRVKANELGLMNAPDTDPGLLGAYKGISGMYAYSQPEEALMTPREAKLMGKMAPEVGFFEGFKNQYSKENAEYLRRIPVVGGAFGYIYDKEIEAAYERLANQDVAYGPDPENDPQYRVDVRNITKHENDANYRAAREYSEGPGGLGLFGGKSGEMLGQSIPYAAEYAMGKLLLGGAGKYGKFLSTNKKLLGGGTSSMPTRAAKGVLEAAGITGISAGRVLEQSSRYGDQYQVLENELGNLEAKLTEEGDSEALKLLKGFGSHYTDVVFERGGEAAGAISKAVMKAIPDGASRKYLEDVAKRYGASKFGKFMEVLNKYGVQGPVGEYYLEEYPVAIANVLTGLDVEAQRAGESFKDRLYDAATPSWKDEQAPALGAFAVPVISAGMMATGLQAAENERRRKIMEDADRIVTEYGIHPRRAAEISSVFESGERDRATKMLQDERIKAATRQQIGSTLGQKEGEITPEDVQETYKALREEGVSHFEAMSEIQTQLRASYKAEQQAYAKIAALEGDSQKTEAEAAKPGPGGRGDSTVETLRADYGITDTTTLEIIRRLGNAAQTESEVAEYEQQVNDYIQRTGLTPLETPEAPLAPEAVQPQQPEAQDAVQVREATQVPVGEGARGGPKVDKEVRVEDQTGQVKVPEGQVTGEVVEPPTSAMGQQPGGDQVVGPEVGGAGQPGIVQPGVAPVAGVPIQEGQAGAPAQQPEPSVTPEQNRVRVIRGDQLRTVEDADSVVRRAGSEQKQHFDQVLQTAGPDAAIDYASTINAKEFEVYGERFKKVGGKWFRSLPNGRMTPVNYGWTRSGYNRPTTEQDARIARFLDPIGHRRAVERSVDHVNALYAKGGMRVQLVDTPEQLPEADRVPVLEKMRSEGATPDGIYRGQDSIYVIRDFVAPDRAVAVATHELVGHGGLDAMFDGDQEAKNDFLMRVWSSMSPRMRKDALSIIGRQPPTRGDQQAKRQRILEATEELFATTQELRDTNPGIYRRMASGIKEIVRKFVSSVNKQYGLNIPTPSYTEADVAAFATSLRNNVRRGRYTRTEAAATREAPAFAAPARAAAPAARVAQPVAPAQPAARMAPPDMPTAAPAAPTAPVPAREAPMARPATEPATEAAAATEAPVDLTITNPETIEQARATYFARRKKAVSKKEMPGGFKPYELEIGVVARSGAVYSKNTANQSPTDHFRAFGGLAVGSAHYHKMGDNIVWTTDHIPDDEDALNNYYSRKWANDLNHSMLGDRRRFDRTKGSRFSRLGDRTMSAEDFLRRAVGDAEENLRRKLAMREGTGVAKNKQMRLTNKEGKPIYIGALKGSGGKSFEAWLEETDSWLSQEEITKFRQWYGELEQVFVRLYGDRADTMMMAWLAAQQNVSPSGALKNVNRVIDRIRGVDSGKEGGLADEKIEGILLEVIPEKGFGPKLSDFVDAGFGRLTRTYVGSDPRGGQPFVADVHTGRDSGHVDQQTLSRLEEMSNSGDLFFNGKPAKVKVLETKTVRQGNKVKTVPNKISISWRGGYREVKVDMTGSPGSTQYEGISDWGQELTAFLNKVGYNGGNWNAAQAQAVGWMRVLRQYGLPEPMINEVIDANTARVAAEVNFDYANGRLSEFFPSLSSLSPESAREVTFRTIERAAPEIAEAVGGSAQILSVGRGDGYWEGSPNPSVVIEVLGSPEAQDNFADALALVSEQGASFKINFGVGGKGNRAIIARKSDGGTITPGEIKALNDLIQNADKNTRSAIPGYSIHAYPDGQKLVIAGLTPSKVSRAMPLIETWASEFSPNVEVDNIAATTSGTSNNWSTEKDGQSYLQRIVERGGASQVRVIADYRRKYAEILRDELGRQGVEVSADVIGRVAIDPAVIESFASGVGPSEQRAGGRTAFSRASPLEGAPRGQLVEGPDLEINRAAEEYARRNGIDLRRQSEYVKVDVDRARRIAQAYEEMLDQPNDPAVKEAYSELIRQTRAQYDVLEEMGYQFTFFDSESDPYKSPWEAVAQLRSEKRMAVFGTYAGFGTEGITDKARGDNPMLQDTGLRWLDQSGVEREVTANDLFRAVHDAFGHSMEGSGFRARGEENAWQAHVRLFYGPAIGAMTSETRGQNSWVNYGPYAERNKTASTEETVFAEQKTGIMPEWTWTEGRAGDMPSEGRTMLSRGGSTPIFYSEVERTVENARQPSAPGAQWMAWLSKQPGIKKEELDWIGVDEWLKSQDRPVKREELIDFIRANKVEVREVVLGQEELTLTPEEEQNLQRLTELNAAQPLGAIEDIEEGSYQELLRLENIRDKSTTQTLQQQQKDFERAAQAAQRSGNRAEADRLWERTNHMTARLEAIELQQAGLKNDTRYGDYQIPGGQNYREILLTLPTPEGMPETEFRRTYQLIDDNGDVIAQGDEAASDRWRAEDPDADIRYVPVETQRSRMSAPKGVYRSPHWTDVPNILAHVRMNERTDADGKRVLFIEEVQSDWHQEGKKKGYTSKRYYAADAKINYDAKDDVWVAELPNGVIATSGANANEAVDAALSIATKKGVPNAPLKTSWPMLAMKRMIRWASENGFDRIAWTTGDQQAERYDLSKRVDAIYAYESPDGTYMLVAEPKGGGQNIDMAENVTKERLADYVGKDLAARIINNPSADASYSGVDLKVGGEGMKGFYDKILPAEINKYIKKWGGRANKEDMLFTVEADLMSGEDADSAVFPVWSLDVTPVMREAAMSGQPMFSRSRVTPKQDADYLATVERGDMETAQRMVDEAAIESGFTEKVFHGNPLDDRFTVFDNYSWFTDDEQLAETYGAVRSFYLNPLKSKTLDNNDDVRPLPEIDTVIGDESDLGLIGKIFLVKSPNQVKSSDPVTYDDQGNVIPLSQRFNVEEEDIRFSRRRDRGGDFRVAEATLGAEIYGRKAGRLEGMKEGLKQGAAEAKKRADEKLAKQVKAFREETKRRESEARIGGEIYGKKKGRAEGMREGRKAGMAEGVKKGRETAEQKAADKISSILEKQRNEAIIRAQVAEAIKDLPQPRRGKFITALRDAKTIKNLARVVSRINSELQGIEKKEMISDIKNLASRFQTSPAVAVDYRVRISELMNDILTSKPSAATVAKARSLQSYIDRQTLAGNPIDIPARVMKRLRVLSGKPLQDMSIGDLSSLREELERLIMLGKSKLQRRVNLDAMEKNRDAELIGDKSQGIDSRKMRFSPPDMPSKMADDFRNTVSRALDRNRMLRINTLPVDVVIDMMDAGAATYDGPIFNTFKRPVDDAYNSWTQRFDSVQSEILEKKRELGIDMMASRRIGVYAADQQETGREKLRNLYRSQDELMTDDQIDAEIDAIIGRMRPEDFEFYGFLRERLDAVRPELRTLMRDLFNEDLAVVDNYFPFRTDYEAMQSDILGERISDSVGWKKLPETGMLQKRRGAGRQAIKVDAIQIYLDHMKDVTYLLEMGPHTKYMRELLERDDVKMAVGDVGYTFLRDWIDTVSRMGGVDSSMRIPWLDAMRRNVGVGILGLKVTTALLNITPVINAVPVVGPGTIHNLGTLLVSREWRKFLVDNMPEIANRVGNDPQFVELYGNSSWDSIRNKIATIGFYPIQRMDLWSAASVGVTAYKKYLRDNNIPLDLTTPNMDAVRYAELMVRRTQSSGNFKDIPLAISRGRGITGNKSLNAAMLQFTNYTLNQWSLLTYEGASAVDSPSDALRAFGIWAFAGASMYVAQLMRMGYYDIVSDLFGGGGDDDRTIADKLTTDGLSAIPYLSPFMGAVIYGGQMVPVFDTLVSTAGGFVQMARGILDADDERTMRGVLSAGAGLGKLAGIPGMTEVEKFGREALISEDRRAIGNAVSEILDMESQFASKVPPARVTATARLAFNNAFDSGVIEQYDENGLPIPRKLLEQRFVQSVSARYRSRSKYE